MNYENLSVSEKIERASEYALILVQNDANLDIVTEIGGVFNLTEAQAKEAYELMCRKYEKEHQSAMKTKIKRAWFVIGVSLSVMIFFAFISPDTTPFFLIIAFVFGILILMGFNFLANKYREESTLPKEGYFLERERQKKIEARSIKVYNWPFDISLFFFSFLMIGFYLFYTHHGVINKDEIKEYAKVTLSENVIFKDLGGTKPNNHNYAFAFKFKGHTQEFRFADKYYKYGKWKISENDFTPGDTLSIQLQKKDFAKLDENETKKIEIINILIKKEWLIDHDDRNRRVEKKNLQTMLWVGAILALSIVVAFLWLRFRKLKRSQNAFRNLRTVS